MRCRKKQYNENSKNTSAPRETKLDRNRLLRPDRGKGVAAARLLRRKGDAEVSQRGKHRVGKYRRVKLDTAELPERGQNLLRQRRGAVPRAREERRGSARRPPVVAECRHDRDREPPHQLFVLKDVHINAANTS